MKYPGASMIAIRVDDIGWTDEVLRPPIKKADQGLELARRFHGAMGGAPYLAGVIPAYVDQVGIDWIRSKPDGMAVALHGWDHGANRRNDRDEFSGLSSQEIREKIAMGQARVGPTSHFIPPYNALPPALAEAIWHEDIRYIWGREVDWPTPPSPFEVDRCWMIPSWAKLYGVSKYQLSPGMPILVNMVKSIPAVPAVLTLHIPWEASNDPSFDGVRRLIDMIRDRIVTPDQYVGENCT